MEPLTVTHAVVFDLIAILLMTLGTVFIVDWATVGTRWKAWAGHLLGGLGALGLLIIEGSMGVGVWLLVVGLMHWVAAERRMHSAPPSSPTPPQA